MTTTPAKANPSMPAPGQIPSSALALWNQEQCEVIRRTLAPGATFGELALFAAVCKGSGLDPFLKEIYLLPVGGKHIPFLSIDGYRKKAAEYDRVTPPDLTFEYESDGKTLAAAYASGEVLRSGRWVPLKAKVRWVERKPADGKDATWRKMPEGQLGKCAEALYYRMSGCPGLSGVNLLDEKHMFQEAPDPAAFACEECGEEMSATAASLSKKAHKKTLCELHRPKVRRMEQPAPPESVVQPSAQEPGPAPQAVTNAPPVQEQLKISIQENGLNQAQLTIAFKRAKVAPADPSTLNDQDAAAVLEQVRQF